MACKNCKTPSPVQRPSEDALKKYPKPAPAATPMVTMDSVDPAPVGPQEISTEATAKSSPKKTKKKK